MFVRKKSLGQNFLRSERALSDIIEAAKLTPTDTILEVGPGEGALTERLLRSAGKVIAVEKDDRLIPFLSEKFAPEIASGKFLLVHDDILTFDPHAFGLAPSGFKIVANIPYYITGQFFRKFLASPNAPQQMVILVQKEVADRIVAHDGKGSILSISVKAYGTPRRVAIVKAGSFVPAPAVDSAIISIEGISKKNFETVSEEHFFELVKKGFGQKRKMLTNTLDLTKEQLAACRIEEKARPEELSVEQWLCLATKRG